MTRVPVSPAILDWATQRSQRFGEHVDIESKFPKLSEWIAGEIQPTLPQLEAFARATSTPLGYFFLAEPPVERLPIPNFRTLGDSPSDQASPNLLDTVYMMQRRQDWMREYLMEEGHRPLAFVKSVHVTQKPDAIAREMRHWLELDDGWANQQPNWTAALRSLQRSGERAGILVVVSSIVGNNTRRKLNVAEFRGFVLVDDHAPLVFINGADGKAAQMFTLAHELAHIWFGKSAAFDLRELRPAKDATEVACDRVAAEFLVPSRVLKEFWQSMENDPERFQSIARRFKVSEIVASRRALDLGLINKAEFLEFYKSYQERTRTSAARSSAGGDFYASQNMRVGKPFAGAVTRAVREGKLLYREAYQLTGLYGQAFERYVATLHLEGAP
jgi:Zn-dependent peptidase ImmA (M78 family)